MSANTLGSLAAIIALAAPPAAAVLYGKDATKSLAMSVYTGGGVAFLWILIGFSMVYGSGTSTQVIGSETWGTINKMTADQDWTSVFYSLIHPLLAVSIIAGGVGHTFKKIWFGLFIIGVFIIIYTAQAFWVWNANQVAWATNMGLPGWMFGYNVLDWSGGLTVHGFAGLVCLVTGWLTGMKRVAQDFGSAQSLTAAILLVIGKTALSLYPGSALNTILPDPTNLAFTATGLAGLNTIVGAFVGVYAYGVWEMILPAKRGDYFNPSNGVAAKGLIVGLVASAAGAGFATPMWHVFSVICTTLVVYIIDWFTLNVNIVGFDAFVEHGVTGFVGTAMIGLFANGVGNQYVPNGSFFRNAVQLGKQCAGISAVILMTTVFTIALFAFVYFVSKFLPQLYIPVYCIGDHHLDKAEGGPSAGIAHGLGERLSGAMAAGNDTPVKKAEVTVTVESPTAI